MRGWLALLVLWAPLVVPAEDAMEEVVVTGEQPGPGLWQVSQGDNTLWILGTLSPLPEKMIWRSRQVESLLERAQSVIAPAQISTNIGPFSGLRLLPSLLRARAIPDGGTLQSVLPPSLYARWQVQKARYLPGHDKVERWRPTFAADELFDRALANAQLRQREVVWPVVEKLAKRQGVPVRRPEVKLQIDNPRGLIQDFSRASLAADIDCYETQLGQVETGIPAMRERANAWATGDVETLLQREDPAAEERCLGFINSMPRMAEEFAAARIKVRQEWLLAAEGALLRNATTLAVVPLRQLLEQDGLLAQLRARGYRIDEP